MSLEDRFDEVRQLIIIGKEKGFLLYDEVNNLLPAELTSSPEDLDELMSIFAAAGIDLVDSDKGYREREGMERGEGPAVSEDGGELDLTPGALDKTNDPVRMYLREMGTVPLLTREGEVAIAKRIEQGELLGHQVDLAHAGDCQGGHPHGRRAQGGRRRTPFGQP